MDKKFLDAIFVTLILAALIFIVFAIGYMWKFKEEITTNPFIYGAKKLDGEVNCQCTLLKNSQMYVFQFNETTFEGIPTQMIERGLKIK